MDGLSQGVLSQGEENFNEIAKFNLINKIAFILFLERYLVVKILYFRFIVFDQVIKTLLLLNELIRGTYNALTNTFMNEIY